MLPKKATMFSQHARSKNECEDGRAEHDRRAVPQRDVLDCIEHAEKEDSTKHALHHCPDPDPGGPK